MIDIRSEMKFNLEKITVQAKSRALKATWTFESERFPPPRMHNGEASPWLRYDVLLDWNDNNVRDAADEIEEWLEDRFNGAKQAYYFGPLQNRSFLWRFQFAQENDAIEFKLRWA